MTETTAFPTNVKTWTDEQLLTWATEEITLPKELTEFEVAQEIYMRAGQPIGTINGSKVLIQTIMYNEAKEAEAKKDEEKPVVVEKPLLYESKDSFKKPPKSLISKLDVGENPTLVTIEANIKEYIEKMMPGRSHSGNEGTLLQLKLFRTFQMILKLKNREFTKTYNWLLQMVDQYRESVFHELYVYRYFDTLTLSKPDRRNFERFINLIITTANPILRSQTVKCVNISATMEGFRDSEMYEKINGFYSGI